MSVTRASGRSLFRAGAIAAALWAAVALAIGGCGDEDNGTEPPPADPFFPSDVLTAYTQVRGCRFSLDHGFRYVRVLINPEAASAYVDSLYPFAVGTVCVKPLYADSLCTDLVGYVTMRKGPPGTAPAGGDWEWQTVGADLKVTPMDAEAVERCVTCHASCTNGRDFTCTDP